MRFCSMIFFCCLGLTAWTQARNQTATYFSVQYNKTTYDYTITNNPWALGVGFQINFLDQASIKPILEVTTDLYLENEKVLRLNPDGTVPEKSNDVRAMVNVLTGFAWEPVRSIYFSTTAGASLAGGELLFGVKPAAGVYFAQRKILAKVYYLNALNRGRVVKQDFESIGLSMGFRIF